MPLENELGFRVRFGMPAHDAVLNITYTAARLRKTADSFFSSEGITDVQFQVLMLLQYQSGDQGGLTQVELSRMLLVNRANVTALVDRMEKRGLVRRAVAPGDRRCNLVKLTDFGRGTLSRLEERYAAEMERIMTPLSAQEIDKLVSMLEEIRKKLA